MPCSDGRDGVAGYAYEIDALRKKIDKLTRMLCNAVDPRARLSKETLEWWAQHQKEDEVRLRREQERAQEVKEQKAALAKLTPRERKLLGV